jgi:leucyl-tRNA synthetase
LVADFCCQDLRLIIEVDGGIHETQREYDTEREALLSAAGYRVVRVRNEEVMDALPVVLERIRTAAAECLTVPPAERGRTRGW